ncbi:MAG: tetratricopeptide repeat protein [Proteobacteria bacterium]|nr:tetratricopeptide repeat protein [Pseudomonadota bacterium]MBU1686540.1 tetratricopeptide repeat protein [Pseudomonadota bacterium]
MEDKMNVSGMVKKEFVVIVALIALIAGFLIGVVFSSYQSTQGSSPNVRQSQQGAPVGQGGGLSSDQAAQILALEQQVADNPQNSDAWTQLGHVYFDNNIFVKAINAYEKSLAIIVDQPDVWTDLGVMYRRNKEPQKAINAFDQAIRYKPTHEQARFNKGIVMIYDVGDKEGGLRSWQELVNINPGAMAPNGKTVKELIESVQ